LDYEYGKKCRGAEIVWFGSGSSFHYVSAPAPATANTYEHIFFYCKIWTNIVVKTLENPAHFFYLAYGISFIYCSRENKNFRYETSLPDLEPEPHYSAEADCFGSGSTTLLAHDIAQKLHKYPVANTSWRGQHYQVLTHISKTCLGLLYILV
jgi:hypothetical protein